MMRIGRSMVAMLLAGAALAPPAMAQTSPAPSSGRPAAPSPAAPDAGADRPSKTPAGATYLLPANWTATANGPAVILSPPEADLHIAIVDAGPAADAKAAAAAAWSAYRPAMGHAFKLATARPPRNGWDEVSVIDYETSPAEHLALTAIARRRGDRWTVMLLDGNEATVEKRGGALGQIGQSLRPAGYARESFAGRTANPLDAARIATLVEFVRKGAADLHIPGVGFALYAGGTIVYEGGIGVKEIGKPAPIDAHTRFMIASNTKSMATLLLAELVGEGRIAWDEPVTKVYPAFRLGDDATTRSVLIRHLVCACTGLPRKDMEWLFNTTPQTPAATTFAQLAATQPTSKFGEAFQYNNLMASAAGYVAAHLIYPEMELGAAFDRAVQTRILDPLGMRDTTLSMAAALAADHASPHGEDVDGRLAVLPQDLNRAIAPYRPAGGAWSSPHDMILYMKNELDEGALPGGRRLVTKDALLARRARGVPIGEDQWYGMGLMEDATWGVPVIHHGGDLAGYHSDMYAIPSAGVAAVFLTNADNGPALRRPFMRRLLELLYDGKPEAEGDVAAAVKRIAAEQAEFRSKLTVPGDPAVLADLAPRYANADLGPLTITREGKGARLAATPWNSAIVTRRNDDGSVSLILSEAMLSGMEFTVGRADGKRTLTLRDGQHTYVFVEKSV
jgi:CubicO group peptidase (beta-lactamase class C family)